MSQDIIPVSAAKTGPTFASDHKGMRVDYQGLLHQSQKALRGDALAVMLRHLQDHMTELGKRYYEGDLKVVDEFLQMYCVDQYRAAAIAKHEDGS